MVRCLTRVIFLMMFAIYFSMVSNSQSEERYVTVVDVLEGDLIVVEDVDSGAEHTKVRIYGIDTPENGQEYFEESKSYLGSLVKGKQVKIEILTTDNLGSTVARVWTEANESVGEKMVTEGLAWWDEENAKEEVTLKKLCAEAIRGKKGLWSGTVALAPWDYRRSKGLPTVKYQATVEKSKVTQTTVMEEEEKKVLRAKGNEVYTGTFSETASQPIDVSKIKFDTSNIRYEELMMKHVPTVARDGSGKPVGLAVPNIGEIPFANTLGFRDGDIITSVNGIPITDPTQIIPLYERLKGTKDLSVTVLRDGKPVTLNFRLP